jgi:hypothetical protein
MGYVDNASLTRALLAVSDDGALDRYLALRDMETPTGYVNQAGVVRALLATRSILPYLPAVPRAPDSSS